MRGDVRGEAQQVVHVADTELDVVEYLGDRPRERTRGSFQAHAGPAPLVLGHPRQRVGGELPVPVAQGDMIKSRS